MPRAQILNDVAVEVEELRLRLADNADCYNRGVRLSASIQRHDTEETQL
jgi:hypothetical protein